MSEPITRGTILSDDVVLSRKLWRAIITAQICCVALGFSVGFLIGSSKRVATVVVAQSGPPVRTVSCTSQTGDTQAYEVKGTPKIWRDGSEVGVSAGCDTDGRCDFLITNQIKCWVKP